MGIVFIIYVQQNKKKRNETGSKELEDDDEEGELYAFIDRLNRHTLLKHFRTFRDDETSRMIDQKCYHPFLHLR